MFFRTSAYILAVTKSPTDGGLSQQRFSNSCVREWDLDLIGTCRQNSQRNWSTCLDTRERQRSHGTKLCTPTYDQKVIVQAWRGRLARDAALYAGHRCIVSSPYYLDLGYPADLHYSFEPEMSSEDYRAATDNLGNDIRLRHAGRGVSMDHIQLST